MTIQEAIHDGDWQAATKGSDNVFRHRLEIETICQMRDDYDIVTGQLTALLKEEYDFYLPYIKGEKSCFKIAEAGAFRKVSSMALINIKKLEDYLETFEAFC